MLRISGINFKLFPLILDSCTILISSPNKFSRSLTKNIYISDHIWRIKFEIRSKTYLKDYEFDVKLMYRILKLGYMPIYLYVITINNVFQIIFFILISLFFGLQIENYIDITICINWSYDIWILPVLWWSCEANAFVKSYMYMYMYICMYACMCMCVCVRVYVFMCYLHKKESGVHFWIYFQIEAKKLRIGVKYFWKILNLMSK